MSKLQGFEGTVKEGFDPCHQVHMGDVVGEIIEEFMAQEVKWGRQLHDKDKWLVILGEEVGEACKGALEGKGREYRAELIQVAAVALSAVMSFDHVSGGRL